MGGLGKRTDCGDARYAGLEVAWSSDIVETLETTLAGGWDFAVAPLVHPRYRRPAPSALPRGTFQPPFTRSDLLLTSSQWGSQIVGKASPWIDCDSECAPLARDSAAALQQELAWAAHLGLQAVVLPLPATPLRGANYARILNHTLGGLASMALWLRIPAMAPGAASSADGAAAADGSSADTAAAAAAAGEGPSSLAADPWEWWNQLRFLCNHHPRLGVMLELGADLPSTDNLERWRGEPLKAVVVPTSVFMTNKRGFPTLSRRHQDFLADCFTRGVQVVLSGNAHHMPPEAPGGNAVAVGPGGAVAAAAAAEHPLRLYWEYLSFLFRKLPASSEQELVEMGYRDYLQSPLQPLQDNLESQTYETFERDATKYTTYEEAVYRCLLDRVPQEEADSRVTVLMVVGAGRGPLVAASLRASVRAKRRLRVYAVEKNPNAVVTLQNRVVADGWEGTVTIVPADMREWEAPEQADILVSELLGSFGDNELSPECLDGAQRFLKPDGVSIPQAYTSQLQPITCHKLWNDVRAYDDIEHFETSYVVKLFKFHPLAPTQDVFTFEHPNRAHCIDNTRSIRLVFECMPPAGTVCHGFAGYFDAQLYKDVHLSIHPPTHTPNMFSWFPIYFPLRTPFYVPQGSKLELHMWRCAGKHKVWYEWAVTQPLVSPIHNPGGRGHFVGL
ncbi:arginine N-methyltransferase [Chlorella sorokiniana]|uniref:Protein arginine N-methyltransferase n=1 Tax=Chlorella sorokiniana TaxID=3076 RepID=A0A2P6TRU4_CHLSO|nr:arginine N-methyltransferase [Chlorella sorokiniana]|eukprot:PRW56786.1 arginine N-methyltransferase [Chlorella sorokiniana]